MGRLLELFYGSAWTEIDKYIQDNNLQYIYLYFLITLLLVFGISYLVNWRISKKKIQSEIDKIRIDYMQQLMDLLERIEVKRKIYYDSDNKLQESMKLLIKDISNPNNSDYWNESASIFHNEYLTHFGNYLDHYCFYLDMDSKRAKYFINDELFRFFDMVIAFTKMMNSEDIKAIYPNTNLIISIESLKPAFRVFERYTKSYNLKSYIRFWNYKKQLEIIINNYVT